MLAALGQLAQERGLDSVSLTYRPTRRNRPAFDFLASQVSDPTSVDAVVDVAKEHRFEIPADQAASCRYRADEVMVADSDSDADTDSTSGSQEAPPMAAEKLLRIARDFHSLEQIHQAVREFKQAKSAEAKPSSGEYVAPRNALEVEVAALWGELLGTESISVEASFFALGGDSLIAVQLLSRVRNEFQVELTMRDALDEDVTVASLALAIERAQIEQASEDDIDDILAELEGLSEEEIQLLLAEEEVS